MTDLKENIISFLKTTLLATTTSVLSMTIFFQCCSPKWEADNEIEELVEDIIEYQIEQRMGIKTDIDLSSETGPECEPFVIWH